MIIGIILKSKKYIGSEAQGVDFESVDFENEEEDKMDTFAIVMICFVPFSIALVIACFACSA